ncbi:MAG TPA: hypothetical protein PK646_00020 [Bacillota bacterium]|nr:hypothetical protein [Fastidiosipila sp.]HPX93391.1 hypothetical protein [Bacillota bacterium]HQB80471.1 hypothetical protein [Bacillota bacterium]
MNHVTELPEKDIVKGRQVLIAGQNELAASVVEQLAGAGVGAFVFLSSTEGLSADSRDAMIRAVRSTGREADLRLIQVSGYDPRAYLFPEETDLLVDCSTDMRDHLQLEEASRVQGIPMILAYEDRECLLTGLVDPYAGSLGLLFSDGARLSSLVAKGEKMNSLPGDPFVGAVSDVCRLTLASLTGQARFFGSKLRLVERKTGSLSVHVMPTAIPSYWRMVLIGSDHRNLDQTSLCVLLARFFTKQGRTAAWLKIETLGQEEKTAVFEENPESAEDPVRSLFEAGCQRVIRLLASEKGIRERSPGLLEDLFASVGAGGLLLCESNTARFFLQPGYFIHLTSPDGAAGPAAIRTRRLADRLIPSPFAAVEVKDISQQIDRMI